MLYTNLNRIPKKMIKLYCSQSHTLVLNNPFFNYITFKYIDRPGFPGMYDLNALKHELCKVLERKVLKLIWLWQKDLLAG